MTANKTKETKAPVETQTTEGTEGAQVQLMKLYIKDASLQIPEGAKAFRFDWAPELNVEINTQSKP
jgi:preprotein translocase subunit SecB